MNTTHQLGVIEDDTTMTTNLQTTTKESKMTITGPKLIRWAGLAALVAGIIYTVIQPIHPPDVLASVTTSAWAIITPIKTAMAMLFLIGITGIYARQVKETGWLGLVGFLLLIVSWMLNLSYIFAETFIIPLLTTTSPTLIDGFFGIVNGHPVDVNLGALPGVFGLVGITYMLGGLLFGIATFRAGILPRWAAGLLAVTSALTPLAALVPHEYQRLAGMPVGIALAWMGYALWSQRQANIAETSTDVSSPQLRQSIAR